MKINEKNLCTFATTPPFDLDGWLNKRGEINKAWQKRWFVLKGNLLFYFERKTDKEPIGAIILEGCTVELAEEGEQYCFQIVFHGTNNRTYYLSAESQEAMELWMKALTCAGYEYIKLMVSELQRQLYEIEGTNSSRAETPIEQPPKAPPRRQNPFNRPAPPRPVYSPNTAMVQSPSLPNSRIVNRDIPPMNPSTTSFAIGTSTFHTGLQQAGSVTPTTPSNMTQAGVHHNHPAHHHHHHQYHNNHTNHLNSLSSSGNDRDDDNLFAIIHEMIGRQIMKEFNERKTNLKKHDVNDTPLIQL